MRLQFVNAIRAFRVLDWWYLLGIAALAYFHVIGFRFTIALPVSMGFSVLYLCWGYVFNNLYDRGEDSVVKNPFNQMSFSQAFRLTGLMMLALVFLATMTGLYWETLFVIILNALYSVPPLRLKRNVVFAMLANGIFFSFIYYASVKIAADGFLTSEIFYVVFVFLLFLPLQFVHYLEHREIEGKVSPTWFRFLAIIPFLALCLFTYWNGKYRPDISWILTTLYSLICLGGLLLTPSVRRARMYLRVVSMIYGVGLFYGFSGK